MFPMSPVFFGVTLLGGDDVPGAPAGARPVPASAASTEPRSFQVQNFSKSSCTATKIWLRWFLEKPEKYMISIDVVSWDDE